MLKNLLTSFFLVCSISLFAQVEFPTGSTRLEPSNKSSNTRTGFEMPTSTAPGLSNPRKSSSSNYSDLGKEKEKEFSMIDDEYLEHKSNIVVRAFTKDKEIKAEYGKDMYLGDLKTTSKSVSIMYRDHEYVDGDRVKIFVNGEVIISNVMLEAQFRGFDMPLQDGFNRIEFQALNQGTSGPNTAQLQIRDEIGNVLATYEWNLLTGNKATAIIVKQ